MKNIVKKLFRVALVLVMILITAIGAVGCEPAEQEQNLVTVKPVMAQGTIDANAGEVKPTVPTRIYTKNFLLISDYGKVSIASDYKGYYHFYDKDGNWLACSNKWIKGDVTSEELIEMGGNAVYFGIVIGTTFDDDLFAEDFPDGALMLALASGLEKPTASEMPIAPEAPALPEETIDPNTVIPVMVQGTIDDKVGEVKFIAPTRVYTEELIPIKDYKKVVIAVGHKGYFHCYDADGKWLKGFGWKVAEETDLEVAVTEVESAASDAVYFRVVVGTLDEAELAPTDFTTNGLKLIRNIENSEFKFQNVFEIGASVHGPWQEGAIFDGKLFLLNHEERGAVYGLEEKKKIADFTFNRKDFFSPHANSMCFGSQYYDKNDKYPLLYVSVYNNYENWPTRYEGHCGVYRVTEDESGFKAELVQVIKIGFTEDMQLWKSLRNNGDVCPYGNFVVDTDNNELYAYVMRDANRTTRFFKFDVPSVSDGKYDLRFGCKVITLETDDIKDQFDTEYFTYLQGSDYLNGMIISVEGLGFGRDGGAILRLVDLKSKKVIKTYDPITAAVYNEPEVLAVDPETKKVYYGSSDGQLRQLTFFDKYIEK